MRSIPLKARIYIGLVAGCAVILLLVSILGFGEIDRGRAFTYFAFAAAYVLAKFFPIEVSHTTKIDVGAAISFALLLIYGPSGIWLIALGGVISGFWRLLGHYRYRWYNIVFNSGNSVLSMG